MKTYGDAVALLQVFLASRPDVDKPAPTSPRDRLYRALVTKTGVFGPGPGPGGAAQTSPLAERLAPGAAVNPSPQVAWRDAAIFDKGELGASWYRKAANPPSTEAPDSGWTLDDTLSTASTLAFALPEGGAIVAAVFGIFKSFEDDAEAARAALAARQARQELYRRIAALGTELKAYMDKAEIASDLREVISRATILKSHMHDMLVDPLRVTGAARGLNPEWVDPSRQKAWVLGPEYLGAVWDLIESSAFLSLMTENDGLPYLSAPVSNLAERPSHAMCTVDAYMQITGVAVNALILYSLISLMPEEALRPGWDPKSFDLMSAVRSTLWQRKPNSQPGKSAYDCWETLRTYLDPKKMPSWVSRIDPETGDARKAFDAIKRRLDQIDFGFALPGHRDGFWFLPGDALYDTRDQADIWPEPNRWLWMCTDGQSEVKDTVLSTTNDSFADAFRGFRTTVQVNFARTFYQPTAVFPVKDGNGGVGAMPVNGSYNQLCWRASPPPFVPAQVNGVTVDTAPSLLEDAGALVSPPQKLAPDATWASGFYPPVGFMDDPIGRDAVAWMGYVLAQYIASFNYKVDVDAGFSTLAVANMFYKAWVGVHEYAGTLLDAGARKK